MNLRLRRIGNSLGVIIPRATLDQWRLAEGDSLKLSATGIRPGVGRNAQVRLDDFKRALALEVVRRNSPATIRQRSLENLQRWRDSGAWCTAYDVWHSIVESGDDGKLFAAMLGQDAEANRLRQSPPYMGMLPDAVLEKLREEEAG